MPPSQRRESDTAQPAAPAEAHRARSPQQARGRQRVESILDCAEALIASDGIAGVTMHSLAKRASASIGSLYHFFPDREAVLHAIAERHAKIIEDVTDRLEAVPDVTWQKLTTMKAVSQLLMPYAEYVKDHPDFFSVMQHRQSDAHVVRFRGLVTKFLALRLPQTDEADRQIYAELLHAVAVGTIQVAYQLNPSRLDIWLEELPHVLTAYLLELESHPRRKPGQAGRRTNQARQSSAEIQGAASKTRQSES